MARAEPVRRRTGSVPWWLWPLLPLWLVTLYFIFLGSPDDQTLLSSVRIFYFHMGSAVGMSVAYCITLYASIAYLVTRQARWDRWAAASAEVGTVLTAVVIISGTIWGRAAWGVWWTWDPKITSTVILWVLFVAYFLLREWTDNPEHRRLYAAILAIVAFADLPVVYMASRWWRSIHPTVITLQGFNMAPSMLPPMFLGMAAFVYLVGVWIWVRLRLAEAEDAVALAKSRMRRDLDWDS
jgi:heme exporter protein C